MPLTRRRRESGFTILQLAIATSTLGAALAIATATLSTTQHAWVDASVRNDMDRRASTALDTVLRNLESVGSSSIATDLSPARAASSVTFQGKTGWAGDALTMGAARTLAWESDPADPANGRDDDGDGLVDEGQIVLSVVSGGTTRRTVLAQGLASRLEGETANSRDDNGNGVIDERGLCLTRAGNVVTVRLTMERRAPDGALLARTVEGSIRAHD